TTSSRSDDGSSPQISLLQSFNFFGQHYSQIYVNHNGHLTFDSSWSSFTPQQFPMYGGRDIIAPYWTDLDNRGNGDIYYVQYTNGSILQQVTQDINAYFPGLNFHANWVFIATWHEVAYFPMTGTVSQTTIQAILTTNGQYSFVLMNYGSLANTSRLIQAGYDTISSSHHFSIPGSMSNNASGSNSIFSLDSNVNVPGRWVFRVDHGSTGPLYPIGGTISSRSDDGSSPLIPLLRSFNFFGQHYSQIYVNHNGHLTFYSSWSSYSPQRFPIHGGRDIIAPYWTDLDNRGNGDIYYVQYTSGSILQEVTQDINANFPALNFHANWVFIATWYEVAYYPMTGTQTTFQAVLTTNGQYSFVLMNYGSLATTSRLIQVRAIQINIYHNMLFLPDLFHVQTLRMNVSCV
uniref:NIDO domain-containing protein n=1 Tax=Fundulus heteroclitus TaxID=8078 RepID=A0A3Q2PME6_FUNHE